MFAEKGLVKDVSGQVHSNTEQKAYCTYISYMLKRSKTTSMMF